MSMGLEIGGISLSFLGWLGSILCCWLPMWRVTAFLSYNTLFVQIIWEGLWRSCMLQSTGQMQCKVYNSMLALGADIQAARALIVIAIVLGAFGVHLSLIGAQCTHCIEEESVKAKVTIVSGVLFLLAGIVTLIPVCWLTNGITREFYDISGSHRELGVALYIGWAASALFLFGGALLCCSCPRKEDKYGPTNVAYTAAPRSIVTV